MKNLKNRFHLTTFPTCDSIFFISFSFLIFPLVYLISVKFLLVAIVCVSIVVISRRDSDEVERRRTADGQIGGERLNKHRSYYSLGFPDLVENFLWRLAEPTIFP